MKATEEPIVVEQTYENATTEDVWKAITEVDRMQKWYFEQISAFEADVGFETVFDVSCGERNYPHAWKVTEVFPGERIKYDWRFDGYEGDSNVCFEITDTDGGAHLRLTHTTVEDFQEGIPEFSRESCLGGWTYFIQESLKKYLATS